MRITSLAVTLALVVLAGAPALAAAPKKSADALEEHLGLPQRSDKDCDAQFARFDANRDGRLTYREYAKGRFGQIRFIEAPSEREVAGFLSRYEFGARQADTNRDGFVSLQEHRGLCRQEMGGGPLG